MDKLPKLDKLDISDVLMFFQMSFTDDDEYECIVKNILDMSGYDVPEGQF